MEQTSVLCALLVVAGLVGWQSRIPEGLHRHVEAPVQVGYLVVRSLTCCAETIKSSISLQTALYHNQIPVLWTATEQSLSASNLV